MGWEEEKERLFLGTDGRRLLNPEQELRLDALSLAVKHHQGDGLFSGRSGYRNRVETVLQTADYFFDYVRAGAHVVAVSTPINSHDPNQNELFVTQ